MTSGGNGEELAYSGTETYTATLEKALTDSGTDLANGQSDSLTL
jgi:hypothetical protein